MESIMRTIYTAAIVVLFISSSLLAQIPNPGFEDWANGEPTDWLTTNEPPDFIPITQTNDAHEGTSALEGTVLNAQGFGVPVILTSGVDGNGFPINTRPNALHGWYKFTSVGEDVLTITIVFAKNGVGIGGGQFSTLASNTTYTEFIVNNTWITNDIPDTAYIVVQVTNSNTIFPHIGSSFIIDDLFYGNATDVVNENSIPNNFELKQNYPNPFNPSTTIGYQLPASGQVTLKVYNILGDEVASLVNEEKPEGSYEVKFDASQLSSGIYFYKLQTGSFIETKKMILLR
jgi:hypothetical protein